MPKMVYTVIVVEKGVISNVETFASEAAALEAKAESLRHIDPFVDDVGCFETRVIE